MANDATVTNADERVVLTLDAGGTSFRFSAMQAGRPCVETFVLPTCGDDLARCFGNLVAGFETIRQRCPAPPVALSFAFPGPADYPNGIIGDLPNLPAFRGGVPLGPMLEDRFALPVFLNNDGDLFAFGEATGGLLPWVNDQLAAAGSPKRFRNLLGLTLGTGLGGGLARDGEMWTGDNSLAAEVHLFRHCHDPRRNAEEGASIRAVRRVYAEQTGLPLADAPDAAVICAIALGESATGAKNRVAAASSGAASSATTRAAGSRSSQWRASTLITKPVAPVTSSVMRRLRPAGRGLGGQPSACDTTGSSGQHRHGGAGRKSRDRNRRKFGHRPRHRYELRRRGRPRGGRRRHRAAAGGRTADA